MFEYDGLTSLRLSAFLIFLPIPVYTLTNSFSNSDIPIFRRQNGNPDASADLYGLGIRVGIYLQVFGMLLSCIRCHERSNKGIRLLSSAVTTTLLLTWTVFVSRRQLSACESWLILTLINAYATPRSAAIKHWNTSDGGGIGFVFCLVSSVWQSIAFLWFFATLALQLPTLGTRNLVWFFTAVDISGWFRILMIVYSALCCLSLPMEIVCYLFLIQTAFCAWTGTKLKKDEDGYKVVSETVPNRFWSWSGLMQIIARMSISMMNNVVFQKIDDWNYDLRKKLCGIRSKDLSPDEKVERWERLQKFEQKFWSCWGFFVLLLTIIGAEKIIIYNDLSPKNDVSSPGQNIPFLLGLITLIEGLASACMPMAPTSEEKVRNSSVSIVEVDVEGQRGTSDQDWAVQEARFREFGERQKEECEKRCYQE